ncbi:MAG: hypothetical protein WKF58_04710 [Ilumatobacteraceae bacterium]
MRARRLLALLVDGRQPVLLLLSTGEQRDVVVGGLVGVAALTAGGFGARRFTSGRVGAAGAGRAVAALVVTARRERERGRDRQCTEADAPARRSVTCSTG